jgi:hypothetical protein
MVRDCGLDNLVSKIFCTFKADEYDWNAEVRATLKTHYPVSNWCHV